MQIPPELIVIGVSTVPIIELRGAIPLAVFVYHLPFLSAYLWAVLGSLIPVIPLLLLLDFVVKLLSRYIKFFDKFFTWFFKWARKRYSKRIEKWHNLALFVVSVIPLPGFGAWTGVLIAYVFGIPIKRAFPIISLGVIIAGAIFNLAIKGIINLPFFKI